MKTEFGIQANCSETVFRFKGEYLQDIPENCLDWGSQHMTLGYSQMLPTEDTICLYFYQTGGERLQKWLEENKIEYDIQAFMGVEENNFIPIPMTEKEKAESGEGGSAEFLRRIPYREL